MYGFSGSFNQCWKQYIFEKKKMCDMYWKMEGSNIQLQKPSKYRKENNKGSEKKGKEPFPIFCKLSQEVRAGKGGAMTRGGHDMLGTCAPTHDSCIRLDFLLLLLGWPTDELHSPKMLVVLPLIFQLPARVRWGPCFGLLGQVSGHHTCLAHAV